MPVMSVTHKVTTVNLSILKFIFLFSDWVALVFPRLGLSFDAVSLSLFSERKKPNKEEHKEDGKANYRRTRPFAFDEVD
jgi:hypothetical protein